MNAPVAPASAATSALTRRTLPKSSTGVSGLDEILDGGLPLGRPTLVCGGAGCGKTLFSMQFLVNGALQFGEPGAFIAFEERPEDLAANVASLGFDLTDLEARGLLAVDHITIDPAEIIESGEYNLEGLFLRLGLAIDTVGAKRVVIDTLETLFGGLSNYGIIRAELKRLFDWLKERGVTAIITAERGDDRLTRHGLEEYVSDCVIVLDHTVTGMISTRRMRVVKYRGSTHGTNAYPFLIGEDGLSVLPITSAGLEHMVSDERISTGIPRLDAMLDGQGYYRGSTILISGTAGAGKSSVSAHFAHAACAAGEKALYFSFEESPAQIVRNMASIGLELERWTKAGLLHFLTARPTAFGLENHLALIHKRVKELQPSVVVFDPVSNFLDIGEGQGAHQMLIRLIDFMKGAGITTIFTSLTSGGAAIEETQTAISSLVDTWILLKILESAGERNRVLYVLKSRGMSHSNQVREFLITPAGVDLADVYVGTEGVLTGSARQAQEERERESSRQLGDQVERAKRALQARQALHREQIAKLDADFEAESAELTRSVREMQERIKRLDEARGAMALRRKADRSADHE